MIAKLACFSGFRHGNRGLRFPIHRIFLIVVSVCIYSPSNAAVDNNTKVFLQFFEKYNKYVPYSNKDYKFSFVNACTFTAGNKRFRFNINLKSINKIEVYNSSRSSLFTSMKAQCSDGKECISYSTQAPAEEIIFFNTTNVSAIEDFKNVAFLMQDLIKNCGGDAKVIWDRDSPSGASMKTEISREVITGQRVSSRSGNFEFLPGTPRRDQGKTTWEAHCKEGGYAYAWVTDSDSNVFNWGAGGFSGFKGGAAYGIGVESALRNGCSGRR